MKAKQAERRDDMSEQAFPVTQLGVEIQTYRKKNQISQEELAAQMGVSTNTIHLWETTDHRPSMRSLLIFADLFELSLTEVVYLSQCGNNKGEK